MTETTPGIAYKLLTAPEMTALEHDGRFEGSADDRRDGYIHLSTAEQLAGTIEKYFAEVADLRIAAVDLDAMKEQLRWEPARDGALFPHLYDVLTLDTVLAYGPLERQDDGSIRLPVTG